MKEEQKHQTAKAKIFKEIEEKSLRKIMQSTINAIKSGTETGFQVEGIRVLEEMRSYAVAFAEVYAEQRVREEKVKMLEGLKIEITDRKDRFLELAIKKEKSGFISSKATFNGRATQCVEFISKIEEELYKLKPSVPTKEE